MKAKAFALATLFVLLSFSIAEGRVITLFETSEPLVESLTRRNSVDISIDRSDFFRGPASIRVKVTKGGIVNGQATSPKIPGWKYDVVRDPNTFGGVRWIMFAWKKPTYDGIMIQLADRGVWRHRYVAGRNPAGYRAVRLADHAPKEWQVVIRDLYRDFGQFTLTGIALTPFKGVALYDSIYLARTECELRSLLINSPRDINVNYPPWDVDRNGRVDAMDFILVGQYFGKSVQVNAYPNPDVNGDGQVNVFDFIVLAQHYGEVYCDAAPTRVSSPVSLAQVPSLVQIRDRIEHSPHRDRDAILLLDRLISAARSIGCITWGSAKLIVRGQ